MCVLQSGSSLKLSDFACVLWDYTEQDWSTSGCRKVFSPNGPTCKCKGKSSLANFAMLMVRLESSSASFNKRTILNGDTFWASSTEFPLGPSIRRDFRRDQYNWVCSVCRGFEPHSDIPDPDQVSGVEKRLCIILLYIFYIINASLSWWCFSPWVLI